LVKTTPESGEKLNVSSKKPPTALGRKEGRKEGKSEKEEEKGPIFRTVSPSKTHPKEEYPKKGMKEGENWMGRKSRAGASFSLILPVKNMQKVT